MRKLKKLKLRLRLRRQPKKLARYARFGKLKDNSFYAFLWKLKKLARFACLGKLKDNSLGTLISASEMYRLLTSLTSLTSVSFYFSAKI